MVGVQQVRGGVRAARGRSRLPGEVWLTAAAGRRTRRSTSRPSRSRTSTTRSSRAGASRSTTCASAHVFSPVTGRVVQDPRRSSATRVKKGEPLADHRVARHRQRRERRAQGRGRPHRRRARLQAQEGALRAEAPAPRPDLEASEDNWRKAKAELERARQKAYLLRAGGVDAVTQTYTLAVAHRRRGARAQHQPGHRGAGAVQRRRDRRSSSPSARSTRSG